MVRFLLVGDGILRETLQARIAALGLSEHFVFAGLVPPSEVPPLIGAMDVLVHTSLSRGSGAGIAAGTDRRSSRGQL